MKMKLHPLFVAAVVERHLLKQRNRPRSYDIFPRIGVVVHRSVNKQAGTLFQLFLIDFVLGRVLLNPRLYGV